MTAKVHFLDPRKVHYKWDNSIPPTAVIDPGDTVVFNLKEVSDGQVTPSSNAEDLTELDLNKLYPLGGPIYVNGAKPGDVLAVEILRFRVKDWGWSGILPGFGLLAEEFNRPYLRHWDLSEGTRTMFKPGIFVPIEPFCGTMGVAPPEKGSHPPMPPGKFGGNMDIRHLTEGATLLLPVWVEGGLFSCGDCHAAQGDGEVCVTGIESPMEVTVRFGLRKGWSIPEPQFVTKGPLTRKTDEKGYYATTGIHSDLLEAARKATKAMIDYLVRGYEMTPEEAYVLCSTAMDLRVSEVVDKPNWIITAYMPQSIFVT